jgi:uncharacterized Tic20 family protein
MPPADDAAGAPAALSDEERNWGMIAHLSALAGFVIPLGNILGPLVVWLMKKDSMPHVDREGKEALNFNISIAIYAIVSAILILVLIGLLLLVAVGIAWLVLVIMASVRTSSGESYTYPFTLRFIT